MTATRVPGTAGVGFQDSFEDLGTHLSEVTFCVVDLETTGSSETDAITEIGAVKVRGGEVLGRFQTLVNPAAAIPPLIAVLTGITNTMVAEAPPLRQVLPSFLVFAENTVLVAHNAAFDLRFLQLKEAATGVRFTQPVLDTLLLSAVAQPQQPSHALEAIAGRLGVSVQGRHSALADALVTAEVLLKLISLLQLRGIRTLGQAIEASQRTWYARLQY